MSSKPDWINPDAVRLLISGLIGRQVTAKPGVAIVAGPRSILAVAEYDTDDGLCGGLIFCDVPLAASLGAAMILLPPNAVADAIRANKLPEGLQENCYEVLNVGARWFNSPIRPHVRLARVHWNQTALPATVGVHMRKLVARLDVSVTVPGYQSGGLSILAS